MLFPMTRIRMQIPSAGIFRLAARDFITTTTTTTSNLHIRPSFPSPAALNHHRHRTFAVPLFRQQTSTYGRFAFKDVSSDESDLEFVSSRPQQQQQLGDSTLENIDSWRWKLTMLLRNKDQQEVVSNEKKDRRDYLQLETLATRMGLYSRQYARVVVFSKAPLPNYRPDLDDKRPLREVTLPFGVHREVDTHLLAHLSHKATKRVGSFDDSLHRSRDDGSIPADEGIYGHPEPTSHNSVAKEKILQRRSLQLHHQQQDWQVSCFSVVLSNFGLFHIPIVCVCVCVCVNLWKYIM